MFYDYMLVRYPFKSYIDKQITKLANWKESVDFFDSMRKLGRISFSLTGEKTEVVRNETKQHKDHVSMH